VYVMFRHYCPVKVSDENMPRSLLFPQSWRDLLPVDVLLSAVSILAVAQGAIRV
jgi:hypothetical protein